MAIWLQHVLAGVLVAGALSFVGWQSFQSLRGKKSKIGSCCAKGCSAHVPANKPAAEKIHFLPVEMLGRKK
ncbi:MAG TPA: hypothetical protein VIL86_07855 [Tepidisphaeraceae bacterium]|jgi:hypothetical protein